MRRFSIAILTTGMMALAACSGFHDFDEVEALNAAQPVGSAFTQRLTAEYRDYTNLQNDMEDHADALHFARKGLAAARGDVVIPEPLSDWNLNVNHMHELGDALSLIHI